MRPPPSNAPGANVRLDTKSKWALAIALAAWYFAVGLFDHGIWAPTEPTVAGVVWEMRASGDWLVPHIAGIPYLEKPPFYYLLALTVGRLAGSLAPWTLRLPAVLFGLVSLALTWSTVKRRSGERAAAAAVTLLASSYPFFEISHRAASDSAALCFCIAALAIFARSLEAERASWRADLAFALVVALSFFAKNFYSALIVLPIVGVFLALEGRWKRLARIACFVVLLTAVVAAPWAYALQRAGGSDFLRVVFVDNTVGRFFTFEDTSALGLSRLNDAYRAEKVDNAFYYLIPFATLSAPWILISLGALIELFRRPADLERRLLRVATVVVPVCLSLSSAKVYVYLLPLGFVFAWSVGLEVAALDRERLLANWKRALAASNAALVFAALILATFWLRSELAIEIPIACIIPALVGAPLVWIVARRSRASTALIALTLCTAVAVTTLADSAIPFLDREKSDREYFARVSAELAGREVLTTYCDDRRLPEIQYELDRRVRVLDRPRQVIDELRGSAPVAIFVSRESYWPRRAEFEALGARVIDAQVGREVFLLLVNRSARR